MSPCSCSLALGGDISNPQSLNRYAYALNSPTTLTDPSGLGPFDFNGGDCSDPAFADSHAQCQGPGSPYCIGTNDPECGFPVGFPTGHGGVIVGGGSTGGSTSSVSPGGGQLSLEGMGNAAFGGLLTCTNSQVTIGGAPLPIGPTTCSVTPLGILGLWGGTFVSSLFSFHNAVQAQKDAWNKGYYGCIGDEMFPFGGLASVGAAKLTEEGLVGAVENNAKTIAGAYYHFTDGRFTAWGASSKVIVPKAAGSIESAARWVKVGGWVVTDAELAHAIYSCSGRLAQGN